jgi:uncharacterized protein YjiS (DUF1127 family)
MAATLKRWWVAYTSWRLEQLAIGRLRGFSDRQLKDIGLVRSEIEHAVRYGTARDRIVCLCGLGLCLLTLSIDLRF